MEQLREWQAYFNLQPPERPFALLSAILANANRDPKETLEPFTVTDFIRWLAAPFDEVDDAEDDESEEDWDDDLEEPVMLSEGEPVSLTNEEPAWMRWKRNIRMYAESVSPAPGLPPVA